MSAKPSIMIVHAAPDVADALQKHFDAAGFATLAFSSAAEAVAWLSDRKVTAVILDLLLAAPELFGLLRRLYIEEGSSSLPAIVFTAPAAQAGKAPAGPADYAALVEQVKHALASTN